MALSVLPSQSPQGACPVSAPCSYLSTASSCPLQTIVQSTQPGAENLKYRMDDYQGHRHCMRVIHVSNGSRLMLKTSPPASTALLRHERNCLNAEAFTFSLLSKSKLPVPRVLRHDPSNTQLGSPFLLMTHLPGIPYSDVSQYLTRSEHSGIERQIRSLASIINQYASPNFGPVTSRQGYKTWREAFLAMLELALMDGEDKLVNLPYSQIRDEAVRFSYGLDEVKDGHLVIPGFGSPQNVLIDRKTNEVTGLTDFGRAFWGDPAMMNGEGQSGPKRLL